jgi:lichenan operon transcriptional antiterminator
MEMIRESEYQKAESFAEKLHLSAKTVRNLLKQINRLIKGHGAAIESKPGSGFCLRVYEQKAWEEFKDFYLKQSDKKNLPQTSKERIQYLLEYLIYSTDYIKLDDLSESMYISKRTLTNDLKDIEKIIKPYNIELIRKPNHGIKLKGKEFSLRLCLANYIVTSSQTKIMNENNMDILAKCIQDCLRAFNYHLSDIALQNLIIHLFIAIKRIKGNHYIPLEEEWINGSYNDDEYLIASKIVEKIQENYQVQFPESEIRYVALHLAGKRTLAESHGSENIVIDHETNMLVCAMIQSVYDAFKVDFRNDLDLKISLCQHLIPLKIRIQCDMNMRNPLLKDIKERFALAYAMAAHASGVINERYKKVLKDDEIGYIALLFALALERQKTKNTKKNILLVCSSGKGSARLLAYKCKEKFHDQINEVKTCDVNSIGTIDFSKIDYVFSTVPIRDKVPVPIMEIKYFLDDDDIERMKKVLASKSSGICDEYYSPNLFLANIKCRTKEEILRFMCDNVKKYHDIPNNFYDAVLEREKLARTEFGNRVAMPHPVKTLSQNTFVCVGILEKPIVWDETEVQVVFLVSVGKKKNKTLQKFYRVTSKFLLNKDCIDKLIASRDYQVFKNLIAKVEAEMEE